VNQPCEELPELPSTPLPQDTSGWFSPAWGMWIGIGVAILAFEIWATMTGHETMSEAVRHGPKWVKWFFGAGLIWLWVHLLVQQ